MRHQRHAVRHSESRGAQRVRSAIVEALESRTLLSAAPAVDSVPRGASYLTQLNGQILLSANDGSHGEELWKVGADGSNAHLLADIATGNNSSTPANFTVVGNQMFFTVNIAGQTHLWITDGTAPNTYEVANLPGTYVNGVEFNNELYFMVYYGGQTLMYKSDGTDGQEVLAITGAQSDSQMLAHGSTLYFTAADAAHGLELWTTDAAGNDALVDDVNPVVAGSNPSNLTISRGLIFFTADDGANGVQVFVTGGSGAFIMSHINTANGGLQDPMMVGVSSGVIFSGFDGTHEQVWWGHTVQDDDVQLTNFTTPNGNVVESITSLIQNGDQVYFGTSEFTAGPTETLDAQIWTTDGTVNGTSQLYDYQETDGGPELFGINNMSITNGNLYYLVDSLLNNNALYVGHFNPGDDTSITTNADGEAIYDFTNPHPVGNSLFFDAWTHPLDSSPDGVKSYVIYSGPTFGGAFTDTSISDSSTIHPFANVTLGDNAGSVTSATIDITLTDGDANGALSGTGLTTYGAGHYAVSGPDLATVQSALQGLLFTPTAHQVAAGQSVSTTFALDFSDDNGDIQNNDTTLTVSPITPTAVASGANLTVTGLQYSLTLSATDPDSTDQAGAFVYDVDWGDGASDTWNSTSGNTPIAATHTYATAGHYSVQAVAVDQNSVASAAATVALNVANGMQLGGGRGGSIAVYIGGTNGNDNISIVPSRSGVIAYLNGTLVGIYNLANRMAVFCLGGNDTFTETASITVPTEVHGGDGNDTISAGGGYDLLFGQNGIDTIHGNGKSLIIGGNSTLEPVQRALAAIESEWGNARETYAQKIAHLTGTAGGLNNGYYFHSGTLQDDSAADILTGKRNADDVFANRGDVVTLS